MTVRVPQFDLPFRFENGKAAEVEQDSLDDIANCVEAVLRTRLGQRRTHKRFGTTGLLFQELPLDLDALANQVRQWEPRVDMLLEQDIDRFEETAVRVRAQLSKEA